MNYQNSSTRDRNKYTMKLQAADQNRIFQKRKTIKSNSNSTSHPDPFEFTPHLVIPEFTIPTVRQQEEEYSNSMDLSDRHVLDQGDYNSNVSENKIYQSLSKDLSKPTNKHTVSFMNPSEQTPQNKQFSDIDSNRLKNDLTSHEYASKLDIVSERTIQFNGGSLRNIQGSATLRQKYLINANRRQSKFFSTDKDSECRLKLPSMNQKESQIDGLENQPKLFKSNFSYMQTIKEKLTKVQRKVIAIGFVILFYIKLRLISGVQLQNKKNTAFFDQEKHQLKYLNDFSQINEKKFQHLKRDNYVMQSFNSLSRTDFKEKSRCLECLTNLIHKIPVIHPDSARLFFFDITNFTFIILNLTYVPIATVINTPFIEIYGDKWTAFIVCSISVYFFSIILSLNMGYYDKGYCIMDRNKIMRRYMQMGFWVDILSTFPMYISCMNSVVGLIKLLNLLVILKVNWIDKFFYKYFEICNLKKRISHSVMLKFFYILLKVLFFVHLFACVFLYMAFQVETNHNWVTKYANGLPEQGWFTKYCYAFYWGITIMTTVGLGDILPNNLYEVFVLSIFMFFSCGTFAYSFNAIGIILEELNQRSDIFVKDMRVVSRYLQMKNVDQELQIEVRKYIEYKYNFENELSTEEEKIVFKRLSSSITEKLVISTNMALIKQCNFLHKNFSEKFLMKLCLHLESESKLNEDIIFKQDDVNKENQNSIKFYILESGQVQILANTSNPDQPIHIRKISKVEDFGVVEFFSDEPRAYTTKVIGSTKLLSIDRQKFIQILKQYPLDFEKFRMLIENIKMNKVYNDLSLKCNSCKKCTHLLEQCPKIHYIADKELTILKNMYSRPQERGDHNRYMKLKINSLYEQGVIQEIAHQFYEYHYISQQECASPYSPNDEILQEGEKIKPPSLNHLKKTPSSLKVQKLFQIPTNEYQSRNEIESVENRPSNKQILFRQPSISYRKSTMLKTLIIRQNTRDNNDHHEDIARQCAESNYSPLSTSHRGINHNNLIKKSNELSQYGRENLHVRKNQEMNTPSPKQPPSLIHIQDITNLKMQEFSIESFEKLRSFKTFFPHNNYETIIMEYDIARPKLKYLRMKKPSQYSLFPKFSIQKLSTSQIPIKNNDKLNVTFNVESLHL